MKYLSCFLVFFFLESTVYAKNVADIFSGSASSSILFFRPTDKDNYETLLSGTLAYAHVFSSGLQLGTTGDFINQSGGSVFRLTVGPGYNFNSNDLENSFFADLQLGAATSNFGERMSSGIISAETGKRFKLAKGISYSPSVSLEKDLRPEFHPAFTINIFKFSILF